MTTKAKKSAPKAEKFTPKATIKANKKFNRKPVAFTALALTATAVAGYFVISADQNQQEEMITTQIKTPVISRTELSKKSNIDIKLFDENAHTVEQVQAATENDAEKLPETTEVVVVEEKADKPVAEMSAVIKQITQVELAQTDIKNKIEELQKATNAEQLNVLNKKVSKLESLNGNIGNLSKIFLAQQLVLLDNAMKVGGNQNMAIENIYNFAKNIAKDEKVAASLNNLLTLTKQQAIITPQALLFYAQKLENIDLIKLENKSPDMSNKDMSFVEKVKSLFRSFIIVRKTTEVDADKQEWLTAITNLQEAIIFTNFVKVEKILNNEKIAALGGQDLANFKQLFNTYLTQQLALQATLGAFIEGYKYDY